MKAPIVKEPTVTKEPTLYEQAMNPQKESSGGFGNWRKGDFGGGISSSKKAERAAQQLAEEGYPTEPYQ